MGIVRRNNIKEIIFFCGAGAVFLAAVFSLTTFKILDRDFWWHIQAGEIMAKTHHLLRVDPFAYTRAGQVYVSTHEWLAQILFFLVYHVGGPAGEIFLRGVLVALAWSAVLLVDWRRLWVSVCMLLPFVYINRPSYMDRPQLFSFVCFTWMLLLLLALLRTKETLTLRTFWAQGAALLGICIFWVNVHGAAVVYGLFLLAAAWGDHLVAWWLCRSADERRKRWRFVVTFFFLFLAACGTLFLSPNGVRTVHDILTYTHDDTLLFVREWQPRSEHGYLTTLGPLWFAVLFVVWAGKRHRFFSLAVTALFGYLSFQAYRHGIFFTFLVLMLLFDALREYQPYEQAVAFLRKSPVLLTGSGALLLLGFFSTVQRNDVGELYREGYNGIGVDAVAADAYAFIEAHQLVGHMFNTYAIGDYLLYRGYPNRRVYVDGRNIDYGYPFLEQTLRAGFDPRVWEVLDNQYHFSYAVIEYPAPPGISSQTALPYVSHLSQNPLWHLVYLDDHIALYVKKTPETRSLLQKEEYHLLTPSGLEFGTAFEHRTSSEIKVLEEELAHMAATNPHALKPRLLLARHFAETGNDDRARDLLLEAERIAPFRPELYETEGMIAGKNGQWAEAGRLYEKALSLSVGFHLPVNNVLLADIFSKAGNTQKARYYQERAIRSQ